MEFVQLDAVDEAHPRIPGMTDGQPGIGLGRRCPSRVEEEDL
jgi:hypothetical protein